MKSTNDKTEFVETLKRSIKVRFEGSELKADIRIIEPINSRKQYCMDYCRKAGNKWIKFSTIVSSYIGDMIEDFKEMELIYEPQ